MFTPIIDFKNCCKENEQIEFIYKIFKTDFIDNRCLLADTIYIDPKSHQKQDDKEKVFWHIITKDNPKTKKREFDINRASRIKWIKDIIINHFNDEIRFFYHYESKRKVIS